MTDDNEEDPAYRPEGAIKWIAGAFALVLIGCVIAIALILMRTFG